MIPNHHKDEDVTFPPPPFLKTPLTYSLEKIITFWCNSWCNSLTFLYSHLSIDVRSPLLSLFILSFFDKFMMGLLLFFYNLTFLLGVSPISILTYIFEYTLFLVLTASSCTIQIEPFLLLLLSIFSTLVMLTDPDINCWILPLLELLSVPYILYPF